MIIEDEWVAVAYWSDDDEPSSNTTRHLPVAQPNRFRSTFSALPFTLFKSARQLENDLVE